MMGGIDGLQQNLQNNISHGNIFTWTSKLMQAR